MKKHFGFAVCMLLVLGCMVACSEGETSSMEKQKGDLVVEGVEKTKEETEAKEVAAVKTTMDPKEKLNEQIQTFFDVYFEHERIVKEEPPLTKEKLEKYYELNSWWSTFDSTEKEEWLKQELTNAVVPDIRTKTTAELVKIVNDTEISEGYDGAVITEVLLDVEIVGVDDNGQENGTYSDIHQARIKLIPSENEYGWSLYDYYRIDVQTPLESENGDAKSDEESIHIQSAVASIVKETEKIAYYQSAINPQDVVVRLTNGNGNTGGDVTPYQEGAFVDSTREYFNVPIYLEVGQTLGMGAYETFEKGYYYSFESLEPNKRITEIITQGQEVIGKGKFVAVVTRIDNRETFYILFEGI